jgi:uncharacterized protein
MLPVTALLTGGMIAVLVGLSLLVSFGRMRAKAPFGDGGDPALHRRIRAQGNFIEYTPMALIGIGLVEHLSGSTLQAVSLGGALALGRLAHAAGMLGDILPLRAIGMILTYASLLGSASWLVFGPVF